MLFILVFFYSKLGVCPSKMTENNRLCLKNWHLFSVESYISQWYYVIILICPYIAISDLPMSTCPSLYNDCCLNSKILFKHYASISLWPYSLYTYVLISLCSYIPIPLCTYMSLCPYVSLFHFHISLSP